MVAQSTLPIMPAAQDKDKAMVRKYWNWESGCPCRSECSKAAWQKAKKWSLVSKDHCAQNITDHLKQSGCHDLSQAQAEALVNNYRHEITEHLETYEDREKAREEERQTQTKKKAEKEAALLAAKAAKKEEARSSASKE